MKLSKITQKYGFYNAICYSSDGRRWAWNNTTGLSLATDRDLWPEIDSSDSPELQAEIDRLVAEIDEQADGNIVDY